MIFSYSSAQFTTSVVICQYYARLQDKPFLLYEKLGGGPVKKWCCGVCGKEFLVKDLLPGKDIRPSVIETAKRAFKEFDCEGCVCFPCVRQLRTLHIEELLRKERGELSQLEHEVVDSIKEHEILNRNMNKKFEGGLSFGQRLAGHLAYFGGSWTFIIVFICILILWMLVNVFAWVESFDPYPFILLNLFLSCVAALQAPVIMMSQNRQAAKDRLVSDYEYSVNLKAELEVRQLHSKLDQFTKNQWERHLELQQMQLDLSEELLAYARKKEEKEKDS